MHKAGIIGLLLASLWACGVEKPIETGIKENSSTFCNPLNLDYRFMKIDGGEIEDYAPAVMVQDDYIIRYGVSPNKLYNSIQIFNDSARLDFSSLNADQNYYFSIAAYNENGISQYLTSSDKR